MPRRKPHHANQKPVSAWIPETVLTALDAHLQQQIAGIKGARFSRQAWLQQVIERALVDAGALQRKSA